MEQRLNEGCRKERARIVSEMEGQGEEEAGQRVMAEARRAIQYMGRQFVLESDAENRDATTVGTAVYKSPGGMTQMYQSIKKSQVFDLARGTSS